MNQIKLGIIGGGADSLIGILHRVAAKMWDRYDISGGVFHPDFELNQQHASQFGVDRSRVYPDFDTFVKEESKKPDDQKIQVVSVLTPNVLHYPMAKALLENGFHVICEKPLTTSYKDAVELESLQKKSGTVFAVTYTYTGYPIIRHMKHLLSEGYLGNIQKVDMQYYQGWINSVIHDAEKCQGIWRLNPEVAGISSCIGDIGTHAFHMLEYLTNMEVSHLLADLNNLYDYNTLDVDGTILLRFEGKAKGIIRASQIATGEENNLSLAIYGDQGAFKWEQENPNFLYHLQDDQPQKVIKPGHAYCSDFANDGSKLPAGHPEGIFDAMGNIYKGVAKAIRGEESFDGEYPTLYQGKRGVLFVEKVVESHRDGNRWKSLKNS
ncbi:MAG: Gfo/Idh/MocA family oxidoreductase [Flavobacteriaceae bacterium]|nr:Gfo/Idh/MocA family oxidoreductase [Flavobacteriaceae bacterium]